MASMAVYSSSYSSNRLIWIQICVRSGTFFFVKAASSTSAKAASCVGELVGSVVTWVGEYSKALPHLVPQPPQSGEVVLFNGSLQLLSDLRENQLARKVLTLCTGQAYCVALCMTRMAISSVTFGVIFNVMLRLESDAPPVF